MTEHETSGVAAYPSAHYPELPAVSIDAPAGWQPIVFPGALVGIRHVVDDGGFNANVLVTHERWPGEIPAADALGRLRAQLVAAGATETYADLEPVGAPGAYLEADQQEASLGDLRVRYRLVVVSHGGLTELVTAVGTATATQSASLGSSLGDIVRSLTVTARS